MSSKYGHRSTILDNIKISKSPDETTTKSSLIMYFKQKCHLLQFSSSSAKYVLRVVNMAADQTFWTISKFQRVQFKLHQKVDLYFKQKCYLLQFLSSSAKYILRVVNTCMAVD